MIKKIKIFLEIFGNKYLDGSPVIKKDPNRDPRYRSPNYADEFLRQHDVVLGAGSGYITLLNCQMAGLETIGKGLFKILYLAEFAFPGAHVKNFDDLVICRAVFQYPYLNSWYDGDYALNKVELLENPGTFFWDNSLKQGEIQSVAITEKLTINFVDRIFEYPSLSDKLNNGGYEKTVRFDYSSPVSFRELLQDSAILSKLLEFSLGRPLRRSIANVGFVNKKIKRQQDFARKGVKVIDANVINFSLNKGSRISQTMEHQCHMLVSRWIMEREELNGVIKAWFKNVSLFNIYDIYIESNNWLENNNDGLTKIMFNNRFLNIVQALESYHKKAMSKVTPSAQLPSKTTGIDKTEFERRKTEVLKKFEKNNPLKSWLNAEINYKAPQESEVKLENKLTQVIQSKHCILDPIFGDNEVINYFPKYASWVRNKLSHGDYDKAELGSALSLFFWTGQLLVAICILDSLGVEDVIKKVQHYEMFKGHINQIKHAKLKFKNQ